jgi:hypothetical protein
VASAIFLSRLEVSSSLINVVSDGPTIASPTGCASSNAKALVSVLPMSMVKNMPVKDRLTFNFQAN